MSERTWCVMALALSVASCVGSIDRGDADEPAGSRAGIGGGITRTGGAGGSPGPATPAALACPVAGASKAVRAPLRRLTNAEYDNTVRDLLGDASSPARAFPPDTLEHGFDKGYKTQTVSSSQLDSYLKAAETLAKTALSNLDKLAGACDPTTGEERCARAFATTFGQRAYRRPLTDAEVTELLTTYQAGRATGDYKNGIRLMLTRMLLAPQFIYRPELGDAGSGRPTAWETATRLSYLVWESMPDAALFDAARTGKLDTDAQIAEQVARMVKDPRAKDAMARFVAGWLRMDKISQLARDPKEFPGFNDVAGAMATEIRKLADDVIWSGTGTVRELLSTDRTFMTKALASYLAIPGGPTSGTDFAKVSLAPQGPPGPARRAGLLTTAGVLAATSKATETSPVLRGKFLLEQILCTDMPPPPANVPPLPQGDTSTLTTRERFEAHDQSACASCHKLMDPFGFAFEEFAADGRYRSTDNGKPVNTRATIKLQSDLDGDVGDAVDVVHRLADSASVRSCVAAQWFRFALGRSATDDDARSLNQLACEVRDAGTSVTALFGALAKTDAFRTLATEGGSKP
jgi:hypothetical protein